MKEIVLCGTVHTDIKGSERLSKVLDKEKPEVITLECAPEYFKNYAKWSEEINKKKLMLKYNVRKVDFTPFKQSQLVKFNRETLFRFLETIYFEMVTAKQYAENNNIKIVCVDSKNLIDEVHKGIYENTKKGIILYFSGIPEEYFELPLKRFIKIFDSDYTYEGQNTKKFETDNISKLLERDKHAVNEILKIKAKKILHVGGAAHIFRKPPNLYELLKKKGKNVRRLKLIEADKY